MYMNGTALSVIKKETGLIKTEVYRLIERCLTVQPDGEITGFYGLIPFKKVKGYVRVAPLTGLAEGKTAGLSGAFMQLMAQVPQLHEFVQRSAIRLNAKKTNVIAREIHGGFLKRCTKFRAANEYPFNTGQKARRALQHYIEKVLDVYWSSKKTFDTDVVRTGQPRGVSLLRPYEEVECDGHSADWPFVLKVKDINGEWIHSTPMKCYLVLVYDRRARAHIGYSYHFGEKNYPSISVARAFASTLIPWKRKTLTLPGLSYKDGAGLPSGVIGAARAALFDSVYADNAMANRAKMIVRGAGRLFGATLNFGRAGEPRARPFIERANKTLEDKGFRKLPTGYKPTGSPEAKKRAVKACEQYAVTVDEWEQILDVIVANANVDPNSSLNDQAPNEFLAIWFSRSDSPIRITPSPESIVKSLYRMEFIKHIRGGGVSKRSPYVQMWGARYSNEALRKMQSWIGLTIRLVFDIEDDIRLARAYARRDGKEIDIGILHALPPWHLTPHTLQQRLEVQRATHGKKIVVPAGADYLQTFRAIRARQGRDDRGAVNDLIHAGEIQNIAWSGTQSGDLRKRVGEGCWISLKQPR